MKQRQRWAEEKRGDERRGEERKREEKTRERREQRRQERKKEKKRKWEKRSGESKRKRNCTVLRETVSGHNAGQLKLGSRRVFQWLAEWRTREVMEWDGTENLVGEDKGSSFIIQAVRRLWQFSLGGGMAHEAGLTAATGELGTCETGEETNMGVENILCRANKQE